MIFMFELLFIRMFLKDFKVFIFIEVFQLIELILATMVFEKFLRFKLLWQKKIFRTILQVVLIRTDQTDLNNSFT